MTKIIQSLALVIVTATMTGCATPYMIDRRRDAADIFTATMGGGLGAKAKIGPLQVGLLSQNDAYGLRGGIFSDDIKCGSETGSRVYDRQYLLFGSEGCILQMTDPITAERHKDYASDSLLFLTFTDARPYNEKWRIMPYHTQTEVVIGCLWSIRLGFNPGELCDFLLGWIGLDIYGDDLEAKKLKQDSNKQIHPIAGKPGSG